MNRGTYAYVGLWVKYALVKSSGVSKITPVGKKTENNRFRVPIPLQLTALLLQKNPPPPTPYVTIGQGPLFGPNGQSCKWNRFLILLRVGLTRIFFQVPSQIWVSDVTFVTFSCDKKFNATHLSNFWEECDAVAHENIFFTLWRFLSHPSRKRSNLGPAGTKLFWKARNVTIRLGLKHVFLFPSQICHFSRKREGAIWVKTDH